MGGLEVVIQGFRLNGAEPPAKVLERVLGCSSDEARALGKKFPLVARRGLPAGEAEALASALRAAGARVEVRAPGTAHVEPAAEPQPPMSPTRAGDGAPRTPLEPPAPVGAVPAMPAQAASAEPPFKVGSLRPDHGPKPRESLAGKYIIGTLRILLPGGRPPPPPEVAPLPAPAHAVANAQAAVAASAGSDDLYGTGVRDDLLDPSADGAALELDTQALTQGAKYVSGGRNLMSRMRASLIDMPANLVRRRRAPKRSGIPFRGVWRSPLMLPSVLGGVFMLVLSHLLGLGQPDSARVEAQQGTAVGEPVTHMGEAREGEKGELGAGGQEVPLNPLLQLAPKPMEAPLAAIMRKRIPGVNTVGIQWPEGEEPKQKIQCMLIAGSAPQREERERAVLATGKRVPLSPMLDSQLRDHAEVMRIASGESGAQYTPLCIEN